MVFFQPGRRYILIRVEAIYGRGFSFSELLGESAVKDKISTLKPWQQGLFCFMVALFIVLLLIWLVGVRQALFSTLTPFLAALIAAYLLAPLVGFMERRRISRPLAIAVLYVIFAIVIFIFSIRVVPLFLDDLQELVNQLPTYADNLQGFLSRMEAGYRRFDLPPSTAAIIENNIGALSDLLSAQMEHLYNFVISLFGSAIILLLVPILTYFFLRDENNFKKNLLFLFPPGYRRYLTAAAEEINCALGAFVRGSLLVSLAVAGLTYAGFLFLGIKFPLVLAIIIGITNLIPIVGPIIGAVPAWLVAFLDTPLLSLKVVILIIIIQQIECQLIVPVIIGRSSSLHPLTIILALLLGGKLFGFTGLLLAVPAALVLRILGKHLIALWRSS